MTRVTVLLLLLYCCFSFSSVTVSEYTFYLFTDFYLSTLTVTVARKLQFFVFPIYMY